LRHEAEQVADVALAELGKPLGDPRAYARETCDRPIERSCRMGSDSGGL
jgi:hypothetical protein